MRSFLKAPPEESGRLKAPAGDYVLSVPKLIQDKS